MTRPDRAGVRALVWIDALLISGWAGHVLFKGSNMRGRGFMDEEVEGAGGRANAGTSYDRTPYHMLLPATRAARRIELLADMASRASFDPEEIGREREVAIEEARLEAGNLRTFPPRRLNELAFEPCFH